MTMEAESLPGKGISVVYIVQMEKHAKIGFSQNLKARMATFRNAVASPHLLLVIPGDRALERRLHDLLAEVKIAREIFQFDYRLWGFIDEVIARGLDSGLEFLERTTPARRRAAKVAERQERVRAVRSTRAQENAYYASLVAERRQRLGW